MVYGISLPIMINSLSDRSILYHNNRSLIHQLSEQFNCTLDDILSAAQEVGFDPEEIEEYIRDRHERG